MTPHAQRRDSNLLDAIEAIEPVEYSGTVWRVSRDGNDPGRCSNSGGRWDDGTFEVLYTSLLKDGAIAELYYHLKRSQPVFPSQVSYRSHEFSVNLGQALKFLDIVALSAVGMEATAYGRLSYNEREAEYPRSQDIGEAAHFLGFDGLIVPSARWRAHNAVLFCDAVEPAERHHIKDHGLIDWKSWESENAEQLPA